MASKQLSQLSLGIWTDSNDFPIQATNKDKQKWITEQMKVATLNACGMAQRKLGLSTILNEMKLDFEAITEKN